tara:strand:- start:636 stop:1199 length:564 start_codon:yes stop_codon:yes gene_type:complete
MDTVKRLLFGRTWKGSLGRVVALLIIGLVPFGYHYQPIYIDGISMEKTYSDKQWTLMQRKRSLGKGWSPDRFDVVVIWNEECRENLCKRVIGLPGETIGLADGKIYINGKELQDTFGNGGDVLYFKRVYDHINHPTVGGNPWSFKPIDPVTFRTIGPNEVWVIGDNRSDSIFGHFPINEIRGKIVLY